MQIQEHIIVGHKHVPSTDTITFVPITVWVIRKESGGGYAYLTDVGTWKEEIGTSTTMIEGKQRAINFAEQYLSLDLEGPIDVSKPAPNIIDLSHLKGNNDNDV